MAGSLDAVNTVQGHPASSQDPRTNKLISTANPLGPYQVGQDVHAHSSAYVVATDAAEAGSSPSTINATAHLAKLGDVISFTSGVHAGLECSVYKVSANSIELSQTLSSAVGTGDTFEILRHKLIRLGSSGGLTLSTPVPVIGNNADGGAADAPIMVAYKDVFTGVKRVPIVYQNLGLNFALMTPVDLNLAFPYYRAGSGENFSLVASPDNTSGNSIYLNIDSTTRAVFTQGSVAHDAADVGNPSQLGGYAASDGTTFPTAVSAANRVRAFFDTQGFQHTKNHSQADSGTTLTAINTTYDNVTTTASSADIITTSYRFCDLIFTLVSGGVGAHDITITAQAEDGATYFDMRNGFLGKFIFDDVSVATTQNIHVRFPCPATGKMRITVTATGTTGALTFTISKS